MESMRIAFVVHKFPPDSLGGTEIYSWSLARALVAAGHEVHVFYPLSGLSPAEAHTQESKGDRPGIYLWRAPLPTTRLAEDPIRQFWHTFRDAAIESDYQEFLAHVQPHILHFQHVQGVSARLIELSGQMRQLSADGAREYSRSRPIPKLVTLHDYWYFCANSQLIRPDHSVCQEGPRMGWNCVDCGTARADLHWLRALRPLVALPFAYRNHYLRRMVSQVDLFLAPSEFLRQQYIRQGFPAERILTIENGLDDQRLMAPSERAPSERLELPPPAARPHFGFLGSLAWQKGVHILIDAFNQLPAQAALTIYGDDSTFPDYARQIKAAARHPHIRFHGPVDYQHVGAAIKQLDGLVVPSLWYENSPLVIQEAYGLQVPVIASRIGALAEKVQEGKTGWLFTPGDSQDLARVLHRLIDQPELLRSIRQNIKAAPSMQQHARQIAEIYSSLLR
ncbi:MAG: glycosyltransferase [Chloroflexi bacterium]|nr:glycosyltransferase [Chloroflexota bacterium]